jgi:selenocysteine lyase/cysteine desulfurase
VAGHFQTSVAHLHLTPSCTSAIANGLAELDWSPGDRILTSGMEHDAVMRPLNHLALRGVRTTVLPRSATGPLDLDALEHALEAGDVRCVVVSAAANVTGECFPLPAIIQRAHAHDAKVFVDGAQAAGWKPFDLPALGVDLFAFAGHKGPQAPYGIAGLYVRPALPRPSWCDTGSVNLPALEGLAAGLDWMRAHEPLPHARALTQQLADELAGVVRVLPNLEGMPTCAVVPVADAASVARRLRRVGVVVSGGRQCAPQSHETLGTLDTGVVRVSLGPTTTEADVQVALAALLKELEVR